MYDYLEFPFSNIAFLGIYIQLPFFIETPRLTRYNYIYKKWPFQVVYFHITHTLLTKEEYLFIVRMIFNTLKNNYRFFSEDVFSVINLMSHFLATPFPLKHYTLDKYMIALKFKRMIREFLIKLNKWRCYLTNSMLNDVNKLYKVNGLCC